MKRSLGVLIMLVFLAACGGGDDPSMGAGETTTAAAPAGDGLPADDAAGGAMPNECARDFAAAAEVDEMEDTGSDLYPAAKSCSSLEEWIAASEAHPDALDGADPETFARNTCLYGPEEDPELEDAALCQELAG